MKTVIETYTTRARCQELIRRAGQILKNGGLVAFPTETVYGLGADALNPLAAKKIYEAKGRPCDNPLIIHIAEKTDLRRIASGVDRRVEDLAEAFWPGPLTLILPKKDIIPGAVTGGLDTVAVRMPRHGAALEIIAAGGGFVAAPSANLSGRPSPTCAGHVMEDLGGRIDMIIDGGPTDIGIESTILDMSEKIPVILRPGQVTASQLREIVGEVAIDPAVEAKSHPARAKAPGMKYRHYAPRGTLSIVAGEPGAVIREISRLAECAAGQGKRVGIIATDETVPCYRKQGWEIKSIGARGDGAAIAANLYRLLREFDAQRVEEIYSEAFDALPSGQAVMNRLRKAAGYRVIHV